MPADNTGPRPALTLRSVLMAAMADRPLVFTPLDLADGAHAVDRGPGIVELVPAGTAANAAATVISAGIHGNETAPLELLLELADEIDGGRVRIAAHVLLIVGHPAAIVAETRYIETNLNRLFTRPAPQGETLEHARSRQLMDAIDTFWAAHDHAAPGTSQAATPLHLDMHTAIRESLYPRFAVEPFSDVITPQAVWRSLAAAGLQAVLSQHVASPTFSHYSRAVHGIAGFTLELGRVAKFGANDLAPLSGVADWLNARVSGTPARQAAHERMAFFRSVEELRRFSEDFHLGFGEDIPNFTAFDNDTLIARDGEAGDTIVSGGPVHVVFPNVHVELGARAALLARPVAAPRTKST